MSKHLTGLFSCYEGPASIGLLSPGALEYLLESLVSKFTLSLFVTLLNCLPVFRRLLLGNVNCFLEAFFFFFGSMTSLTIKKNMLPYFKLFSLAYKIADIVFFTFSFTSHCNWHGVLSYIIMLILISKFEREFLFNFYTHFTLFSRKESHDRLSLSVDHEKSNLNKDVEISTLKDNQS